MKILASIVFAFLVGFCGDIGKSNASQFEQSSKVRIDLNGDPAWVLATDVWAADSAYLKLQFLTAKKKLIPIGEFDQEGNAIPQLASVFKAKLKSGAYLIIIVAWPYSLPGVDTVGKVFEVHAYKIVESSDVPVFSEDLTISNLFGSGFDGVQEGKAVRFEYRDASKIRKKLKSLRYLNG